MGKMGIINWEIVFLLFLLFFCVRCLLEWELGCLLIKLCDNLYNYVVYMWD